LAATAKNAKLLQNMFFAAEKLLLHVVGINNVPAITSFLQQQLMSMP
jgi:hypothetical protein